MYLLTLWFPLISFIACSLLGSTMGQSGACIISCSLLVLGALMSWGGAYLNLFLGQDSITYLWDWVPLSSLQMEVYFMSDKLSSMMLTMMFSISSLVHIYSTSYMWGDPHLPSFMSYLSLFTFFMVILVQAGNIPLLFIGWEGVGLCSYLLVNFWYSSLLANTSAMKAMLVNSVGDLALIVAMAILWNFTGGLDWVTIQQLEEGITIVCVMLLIGAAGKSAQLGLHTWLPDAMEGPTPVSALIHAATMVTAGVFLILSCAPLFEKTSSGLLLTLLLGSVTAFFAASTGLSQTDMKKVMAYSTTSQLGYMVASCGLSYFSMGFNHLVNHAYFKALLFLSAGAVIHANLNEQDLSKIGAQWTMSPLTLICVIMGSISLMGFPFMTGFYSKDLMLELSVGSPSWMYLLLLGGAGLTAAYSAKMIMLTFTYSPLMGSKSMPSIDSNDWKLLSPLCLLALGSVTIGFLTQGWMNFPLPHPLLHIYIKCLPLILSVSGALTVWLLYFKDTKALVDVKSFSETNTFLFNAWQFNLIINALMSKTMWGLSHQMYKLIDKGWMEGLLPGAYMLSGTKLTSKLTTIQSGETLNYITLLIMFFTLVAFTY